MIYDDEGLQLFARYADALILEKLAAHEFRLHQRGVTGQELSRALHEYRAELVAITREELDRVRSGRMAPGSLLTH